ncbi:MAG: tRNA (adenosine(37)-N6)-threonylcarbamoyltransferase complex dimerization subunit type 1 TsaB [Planctomycetaceae bacterium]|jgi:tRNA threonylcarbamoyladenosine biosynthesis protein TsaB|nr:tRNA (adenosine(37)-N6)-threonylcarbamoyltransferase complex dimerization subunit type 1 TsaB [Planctomycetaceae bacterium]
MLLSIETIDKSGSIAIFQNGELLSALDLASSERSAKTLCPAINAMLNSIGIKPHDINTIAVATGPGSFTGLRVGIVTAKMFAYAVGAEIVGVDTLETLAFGTFTMFPQTKKVAAAIDAQRGDVVAQIYEFDNKNNVPQPSSERQLIKFTDFCNTIREQKIPLASPLLIKQKEKPPADQPITAPSCWQPTAVNVGKLAMTKTEHDNIFAIVPTYSRPPAPCEKVV